MKYELKLNPFITPNFSIATHPQRGADSISIPLSDLSEETLEELCKNFRDEVFKKARIKSTIRSGTSDHNAR